VKDQERTATLAGSGEVYLAGGVRDKSFLHLVIIAKIN
jgi:hypothetical protein